MTERTPEAGQRRRHRPAAAVVVFFVAMGLLVVVAAAVIVARDEQQEAIAALAGTTIDAPMLPRSFPFEEVAGHLVIDVGYPDTEELVRMILDTGAPVMVSEAIAERSGGDPVGRIATIAIDGSIEHSDVVPIGGLDIGGTSFHDVAAIKGFLDPENPLACISEHGLIGASLMQAAVWQIDYDAAAVTIAASAHGLDHIDGAIAVPFERGSDASPSPIIEIPAGEATLRLLIDTGSDGWIAVHPDDLTKAGTAVAPDAPTVRTIAAGAGGTFETSVTWTAADLQLGAHQLSALPIATTTALSPGQGNIGNDFLSDYVVTIDWTTDTLYLDPVSGRPEPEPPRSLALGWDAGVIVGSLVEGAPGTNGLELGSPVAAFEDLDVTEATFERYCELSEADREPPYEVTLASDPPRMVQVARDPEFLAPLAR